MRLLIHALLACFNKKSHRSCLRAIGGFVISWGKDVKQETEVTKGHYYGEDACLCQIPATPQEVFAIVEE